MAAAASKVPRALGDASSQGPLICDLKFWMRTNHAGHAKLIPSSAVRKMGAAASESGACKIKLSSIDSCVCSLLNLQYGEGMKKMATSSIAASAVAAAVAKPEAAGDVCAKDRCRYGSSRYASKLISTWMHHELSV